MILYVLMESLHVVGVIDTWSSLIWTTKLQSAGTFELCVTATPRNKKFLQSNRFIARSDIAKLMYINTIEDNEDDGGKTLIVSGYSAEGILRKRMYPIWSDEYKHGGEYTMIDTFRAINPLGFRLNVHVLADVYTAEVNTSDLQKDMETYVRNMLTREGDEKLEEANFWQRPSTYMMEFDYNYPQMGMLFVKTYLDTINDLPTFIFSEDIGNIKNVKYSYSEEGCASCIIAMIDKEANITYQRETTDENGETVYEQINLNWSDLINTDDLMIYETVEGAEECLRRNEKVIYVDPVVQLVHERDYSKARHRTIRPLTEDELRSGTKYASEGQKEEYWAADESAYNYYALDQQATLNAMRDAINDELLLATENIQGNVIVDKMSAYNIGNIAIFRDNERAHDYYKRIEEIEEVFDSSGYSITPTFGEPLKGLKDVVKFK